jgi:hypothetical protein
MSGYEYVHGDRIALSGCGLALRSPQLTRRQGGQA